MGLDEQSQSISPLPESLSRGLVAVASFGLLSFCCSTSLFFYLTWRLISWQRRSVVKRPTNQFLLLIYNLLFADIQQACAFLLNIGALRDNAILVGKPLCFAQGWFVSTGDLASSVFISAIAVHTFFGVVRNYRLPTWAFYCAIALCWLFVYVMAAIGPLIHGKDFYVRASAWCWINKKYSGERLWYHYFWIFVGMFSTILIYGFIYLWLRRKRQAGIISRTAIRNATPLMILYPLIYTICTAPLASLRIYALAGHSVSLGYFCMAGTMIACNGWLDVLLYASTRADIVFCDLPPGESTGLDTFNFMGRHLQPSPLSQRSNTGARSNANDRKDLQRVLGSGTQENPSHVYGMGTTGTEEEVAVSVASLVDGSVAVSPIENDTITQRAYKCYLGNEESK